MVSTSCYASERGSPAALTIQRSEPFDLAVSSLAIAAMMMRRYMHEYDAALAAYYRAADLFLCLSEHEGFCLPPLVAAAHGFAVLLLEHRKRRPPGANAVLFRKSRRRQNNVGQRHGRDATRGRVLRGHGERLRGLHVGRALRWHAGDLGAGVGGARLSTE